MFSAGSCFNLGLWGPRDRLVVRLSDATSRRYRQWPCAIPLMPTSVRASHSCRLPMARSTPWSCRTPSNSKPIPMPSCARPIACSPAKASSSCWVSGPSASGAFAAAPSAAAIRRASSACWARGRIADWLELLGYDVSLTRNYLFTPPWGGSRAAARRALGAAAPGLDQALARRRVPAQGAQARLHAHADPPASARARAAHRRPGEAHHDAPELLMRRDDGRDLHGRRLSRQSGPGRLGRAAAVRRTRARDFRRRSRRPLTTAWSSPR